MKIKTEKEHEVAGGAFCDSGTKVKCMCLKRSPWEASGYRCTLFGLGLSWARESKSRLAKCKPCLEACANAENQS